ncbi:hypothetical protein EAF00_004714 [Botryotinia globosa]|nr:hypothetical protein EAF00_004714 [Botryotinia globosa]
MHSSNSGDRTELPGSRDPGNPLSPAFRKRKAYSQLCIHIYYNTYIYFQGERNAGMGIQRAPKREPRKPYFRKASDGEKEKLDSILGDASRSKTQYQDQHTRARGENVPNVATTAPPSETIPMSLDMSTGTFKEPHITLTIPAAFQKYHVTIIDGNTTSNYAVNGEATASTPRHVPGEI